MTINILQLCFSERILYIYLVGHQSSFHHHMITILMFSSGDENFDLGDDRTGTHSITRHKIYNFDNLS